MGSGILNQARHFGQYARLLALSGQCGIAGFWAVSVRHWGPESSVPASAVDKGSLCARIWSPQVLDQETRP
jgi:hypothetical protein